MILDMLLPFVRAFKGLLWHDTMAIIIPPLGEATIPVDYYPGERPAIIYYLYPGEARIYDPATGTLGNLIHSMNVGFKHEHAGWMKLHNDPLVVSFLYERPYQLVGFLGTGKAHKLYLYNSTSNFVWIDVTIWIAEFEKGREKVVIEGEEVTLEEAFDRYLRGIFRIIYHFGKESVEKELKLVE